MRYGINYIFRFIEDLVIFSKEGFLNLFYRINWPRLPGKHDDTTGYEVYEKDSKTFRRGICLTIIGLLHVIAGFLNTIFAIVRMSIIGFGEPFAFSKTLGIFNITYELIPVILWLSGIGLLRAKRWGYIFGSIWAVLAIFFHITSSFIRQYYWGDFAAPLGWVEYLIIYYAIGFISITIYMRKKKII